jgi:hypothetical protein
MSEVFQTYVNLKDRLSLIIQNRLVYLNSFWNNKKFFFSKDIPLNDKINVTSTCFSIFSLFSDPYAKLNFIDGLRSKGYNNPIWNLTKTLIDSEWITEDLPNYNIYTTSIALTAIEQLSKEQLLFNHLDDEYLQKIKDATQKGILELLNKLDEMGGARYKPSPNNAFLTYWCTLALDLYTKLDERLINKTYNNSCKNWIEKFKDWSLNEIYKQISHHSSGQLDKFDPTQLAFAIATYQYLYNSGFSYIELDERLIQRCVDAIFDLQLKNGLWPKFSPIFYTQQIGSVYPFTFQMMDALLSIVNEKNYIMFEKYLKNLSLTLRWAEENILNFDYGSGKIIGWRSDFLPTEDRIPQSWSTATVFCAMSKLYYLINLFIRREVMQEFISTRIYTNNYQKFDRILDCTIPITHEPVPTGQYSLMKILDHFFIRPRLPDSKNETGGDIAYSAVFFGPTGTSKTSLAEAIAHAIGWDYIKIIMGNFLSEGEDRAVARAHYIFERLKNLEHVVILFDEIEELVRSRTELNVERYSRMLTTSMLPLLQDLRDNKEIIFIAATNYMKAFDTAIIRPGRFDMLLRVGPPNMTSKNKMIDQVKLEVERDSVINIPISYIELLKQFIECNYNNETMKMNYFLYYEWKNLLKSFFIQNDISHQRISNEKHLKDSFTTFIIDRAQTITLNDKENIELQREFKESAKFSRILWTKDPGSLLTKSP